MRLIRFFLLCLVLVIGEATAGCLSSRAASASSALPEKTSLPFPDSSSLVMTEDSLACSSRTYPLNSNFEVTVDTLWLQLLPFRDTMAVGKGDMLVVAEVAFRADDPIDSVWVKVARDQETIGWLRETVLLDSVVPVDPISRCIHWFSGGHVLPFWLVLGVFSLWLVVRAVGRKPIRLIGMNDIDSIFPLMLSWLLSVAAIIYNSIQHFVPSLWERYYYAPSLNPFELPFVLGLFVACVWLILLLGMAMLDDLFHQTTLGLSLFYLAGTASCCIFLYTLFTYLPVWAAYPLEAAYTFWCFSRLHRSGRRYPYACGACGAKMRSKGVCPHCGALNE